MESSFLEYASHAASFSGLQRQVPTNFIGLLNGHLAEEGQLNVGSNNLHLTPSKISTGREGASHGYNIDYWEPPQCLQRALCLFSHELQLLDHGEDWGDNKSIMQVQGREGNLIVQMRLGRDLEGP